MDKNLSEVTNSSKSYKFSEFFRKWGFSEIKLSAGFAEVVFSPTDDDQTAAWELYVELLTRVSTQPLSDEDGDETAALSSIYNLFDITRGILREKGRRAENFTKISIIILNQIIRPFTSKWHGKMLKDAFHNPKECALFRKELSVLQGKLIQYARMLADIAMVEDLTEMVE